MGRVDRHRSHLAWRTFSHGCHYWCDTWGQLCHAITLSNGGMDLRILYGVQGTGNGHITRARAMSQAFTQRNVSVDFLFSGRERADYFSMECFGDFHTRRGLSFVTERGHVDYLKTAMQTNLWTFFQEVKRCDLSGYDLVINDFEPVSAWAAKFQSIPCISLSHQNAFRYSVPLKGATWLDQAILQHFAPADHHLALHWYHFNQSILPPSFIHHYRRLVDMIVLSWSICHLRRDIKSVNC